MVLQEYMNQIQEKSMYKNYGHKLLHGMWLHIYVSDMFQFLER